MLFVSAKLGQIASRLAHAAPCSVMVRRCLRSTSSCGGRIPDNHEVLQSMSESDKQKFVDLLNELTEDKLGQTKGMTKQGAYNLLEYKKIHGPLKSVDDLWNIKNFPRIQMLNMFSKGGGILPLRTKELRPSFLTEEQKSNIQSIVSIDVGVKQCAWTHITRDLKVLGWSTLGIDHIKQTYDPKEYAYKIKEFTSKLPRGDVYLVELQSLRQLGSKPGIYPFMIQIRITEAMIHCFLSDFLVFAINPVNVKNFFSLQSGNKKKESAVKAVEVILKEIKEIKARSKIKGQHEVDVVRGHAQKVLSYDIASSHEFLELLDMPYNMQKMFAESKKRDDLSDCLLQALYFIHTENLVDILKQAPEKQHIEENAVEKV